MLDTESDLLVENLKSCSPTYIKPNISETGRILGRTMKTDADFIEALELLEKQVAKPLISAADKGVFFKNTDGKYYNVVPPDVKVVSTVGAGDSFIAGFVMSVSQDKSILDAVKMGAACGTATVMTAGTSPLHPKVVMEILEQVKSRIIG
jgi:fructose-1-phosphate kinase PfkB-like protein